MTKKIKKINNYLQWDKIPNALKQEALKKALFIGYKEEEAKRLFYNVSTDLRKLEDGVLDKDFSF